MKDDREEKRKGGKSTWEGKEKKDRKKRMKEKNPKPLYLTSQ